VCNTSHSRDGSDILHAECGVRPAIAAQRGWYIALNMNSEVPEITSSNTPALTALLQSIFPQREGHQRFPEATVAARLIAASMGLKMNQGGDHAIH
jgi:hypothetical protein